MQKGLLTGIFILTIGMLWGQTLERTVIATNGEFNTNGTAQLSQTIGEPITEFFSDASTHLTQGFQQGELLVILPVEWLDFTALRLNEAQVELVWDVMWSEIPKTIQVERQLPNEVAFTTVRTLDRLSDVHVFQIIDNNTASETSYYRLRLLASTGEVSYSPIRSVDGLKQAAVLTIAPNPCRDIAVVDCAIPPTLRATVLTLQLRALNGHLLWEKRLSGDIFPLQIQWSNYLPGGSYWLSLSGENGFTISQQIQKL